MSPSDLVQYLDALRAARVMSAAVVLPGGGSIQVQFEPELPGVPVDAEAPAGGWKNAAWKGEDQ